MKFAVLIADGFKRGDRSIEEIGIINEFTGTLVRDGFSAYQKYEQCRHSLCNAHLLRDLTFVGEDDPDNQSWTDTLAKLLIEIKEAVEIAKAKVLTTLEISIQTIFLIRYDAILTEAEETIRGSPKVKSKLLSARSLPKRLVKNKDLILRFMTDFSVPFDNNGSEGDFRQAQTSAENIRLFSHNCRS